MDLERFDRDIEALETRLACLLPGESQSGDALGRLVPEVLEELRVSVEELRVAQSEMRRQSGALREARRSAAAQEARVERISAEREVERRYRALFEQTLDPVAGIDGSGRFFMVNRACVDLLGSSEADLLGARFLSRVDVPDRRAALRRLHAALRGEPSIFEAGLLDRGGARLDVSLTLMPAAIEDAEARAFVVMRDVTTRNAAERSLRFLLDATDLLTESLDPQDLMDQVARLAAGALGGACLVYLLESEGTVRRRAVAHVDPSQEERLRLLPADLDSAGGAHPALDVLRTGEAAILTRSGEGPEAADPGPDADLRLLGSNSTAIFPLIARRRTLGAIAFVCCPPCRMHREEDLVLARDLAHRVALALDNVRLYQQEHRVAEILQVSFLPDRFPNLPNVEIGHAYLPAQERVLVGGDFYDLFELSEGRHGVVMGDVCGKGVTAAVTTAMARYALRAFASEFASPATALTKLDRLLYQHLPDDRFVSIFFGILDLRQARLVYASGGHEPPLVERAAGQVELLDTTGPVVGTLQGNVFVERAIAFGPGDSLLLYTDGLSEARQGDRFLGIEGAIELFRRTRGMPTPDRVNALVHDVRTFTADRLRDDMALLLIQILNGQDA